MKRNTQSPWLYAGAALAGSQALAYLIETNERKRLYAEAVAVAEAAGKPLLLVGMPRPLAGQTPCSPGVTLDLDPAVRVACPGSGVVGDIREIPFPDGHFGAVAAFHVLEHLPDVESAQRAWRELWRVTATRVFVAYPRRWNFYAAHLQPEHALWVEPLEGNILHVQEWFGQQRTAWIRPDGTGEVTAASALLPA